MSFSPFLSHYSFIFFPILLIFFSVMMAGIINQPPFSITLTIIINDYYYYYYKWTCWNVEGSHGFRLSAPTWSPPSSCPHTDPPYPSRGTTTPPLRSASHVAPCSLLPRTCILSLGIKQNLPKIKIIFFCTFASNFGPS